MKQKAVYIIEHNESGKSGHGPFRSVEFCSVNTSYPKVTNDTVTYSVVKLNGERAMVTVSMVHSIQASPND